MLLPLRVNDKTRYLKLKPDLTDIGVCASVVVCAWTVVLVKI